MANKPLSSFHTDKFKDLFKEDDLSNLENVLNINNDDISPLATSFLPNIQLITQAIHTISKDHKNNPEMQQIIDNLANTLNGLKGLSFANEDKDQVSSAASTLKALLDQINNISGISPTNDQQQTIDNAKENLDRFIEQLQDKDIILKNSSLSMQALAEALKIVNGLTDNNRSSQYYRSLINIFETLNGQKKNGKLFDELYTHIYSLHDNFNNTQSYLLNTNWENATQDDFEIAKLEITNLMQQLTTLQAQTAQINDNDIETIIMNNIMNFFSGNIDIAQAINNLPQKIIQNLHNNKNLNDTIKDQLTQELEKLCNSTLANNFSKSLNHILLQRLDKIVNAHTDKNKNDTDIITQISHIRGSSNKFDSAFNSIGQNSSNLLQNIATYQITKEKDYNPLHSIRDITIPNVMKNIEIQTKKIAALQYEYDSQQATLMQIAHDMEKAFAEGNIELGNQLKESYEQQHTTVVTLMEYLIESAQKINDNFYGRLNIRQREQLGTDIKGNIDNILQQTQEQVKAILVINEGLHLNADIDKLTKIKKLTDGIKEFDNKLDETNKKSKQHTANLHTEFMSLINGISNYISSIGNLLSSFGLKTIASGPISVTATTYEYDLEQGRKRYASMGADAFLGITDLDESAIRAQQQMLYGNELFIASGGRINQYVIRDNYENMVRNIGGQVGLAPDQTAKDLNFFANKTVLLSSVLGIDQSVINESIKTFYKDIRMSADQAGNAFVKLIQQAQSANVPIDQYIATFNELAKQYMQVGITGEKAGIVLDNLMRHHIRLDIAKEVASQLASGLSTFGQNKNLVAFSGAMMGMDPFQAIANMAYTHEANGDPREQYINDAVALADTYINTIIPAYGSDPDLRMMGLVDIFKEQFGFSQRTASMLARDYLENGNTQQFRDKFKEAQEKVENPNATLEDLNEKALGYLHKMAGQLAESDRLEAVLKGQLFQEARHIGSMVDSVLKELAPLLRTIQGLTLEFTAKIIDWLSELVTSDLFNEAKDKLVDA